MTTPVKQKNILELFKESTPSEDSLQSLRKEARKKLSQIERPGIKHEAWKYSKTRWLEENSWTVATNFEAELPEANHQRLVFFDGVFSQEQSHFDETALSVSPLKENLHQVKAIQEKFSSESSEFFPLLNESFLSEGLLLTASGQVSEPVELFFLWSKGKDKASFTKNFLHMKAGSSLTLKEVHETLVGGGTLFSSSSFDMLLERDSQLRYKKLFSEAEGHRHISHTRSYLEKNANLKSFLAGLGGDLYRQDTLVKLADERAEATLNGLYIASEEQTKDFCFSIKHEAPKTKSHQYFKGFATGKAKGIFQGSIVVSENAAETRSRQLNKNLILGDTAEIYTKPQLQIDTDDVKCSHGATVSQVREDELFYLQTRGLSRNKAMSLLTTAFLAELLEQEKQEDLDIFEDKIKESMSNVISQSQLS